MSAENTRIKQVCTTNDQNVSFKTETWNHLLHLHPLLLLQGKSLIKIKKKYAYYAQTVCCQDAGGFVSGGSTSDSGSAIAGVSAFSGGSGSSSSDSYGGGGYSGDNIGVRRNPDGTYENQFYLHPFLRDILSFVTGGSQRTRPQGTRCPPTSPCRLRGGKCCPLLNRRRRRVCPIRC